MLVSVVLSAGVLSADVAVLEYRRSPLIVSLLVGGVQGDNMGGVTARGDPPTPPGAPCDRLYSRTASLPGRWRS
eukprot:8682428-Pyramimonas_sp.AAC.1